MEPGSLATATAMPSMSAFWPAMPIHIGSSHPEGIFCEDRFCRVGLGGCVLRCDVLKMYLYTKRNGVASLHEESQ